MLIFLGLDKDTTALGLRPEWSSMPVTINGTSTAFRIDVHSSKQTDIICAHSLKQMDVICAHSPEQMDVVCYQTYLVC